jgi:hypothetical protein
MALTVHQSLRPHKPFVSLLQLAGSNISEHAQVDRGSGLCVQHILADPGQIRAKCTSYVGD